MARFETGYDFVPNFLTSLDRKESVMEMLI